MYPGAKDVEWELKKDIYAVDFRIDGKDAEAYFNADGIWLRSKEDVNASSVPAAVKKAVKEAYPDFKIEDYDLVKDARGNEFYSVEIEKDDLDMIYRSGPGHGGNAMVAQDWLDGSYTEVYPNIAQDKDGMKKLFKQFSFLGGVPSHVAPETPGSINEGGELGYSLAHAFGAVADNPDPIAACVVADGEAETGPLATSWHGNKFANPITDGAVLP